MNPEPVVSHEDRLRPPPPVDPTAPALACPRCKADLAGRPLVHRGTAHLVVCVCGREQRVIRAPRPVEPRQRVKMKKKDRRRLRAAMAADQAHAHARLAPAQRGETT